MAVAIVVSYAIGWGSYMVCRTWERFLVKGTHQWAINGCSQRKSGNLSYG